MLRGLPAWRGRETPPRTQNITRAAGAQFYNNAPRYPALENNTTNGSFAGFVSTPSLTISPALSGGLAIPGA